MGENLPFISKIKLHVIPVYTCLLPVEESAVLFAVTGLVVTSTVVTVVLASVVLLDVLNVDVFRAVLDNDSGVVVILLVVLVVPAPCVCTELIFDSGKTTTNDEAQKIIR
jgi:hypothetical protein